MIIQFIIFVRYWMSIILKLYFYWILIMDSEYKTEVIRPKIRIKNLNQLLQSKKIIALPETVVGNKLQLKFPQQSGRIKNSTIKSHVQSNNNAFYQSEKMQHPLKNNKIYDKNSSQSASNFRKGWNSQLSMELTKRNTMPHFRSRSVQLQNYSSTNSIWKPFLVLRKPIQQSKKYNKITQQSIEFQQLDNMKRKKIQFLKKGSDINKRVVVSLLKAKLGQKLKKQQQDGENTIKNFQILKMIKIYKGYDQSPSIVDPNQTIQMKRTQNDQSLLNNELKIQTFPFHNTNIQLSVSQWNRKRQIQHEHERYKMPSDISEQF